MWPCMKTQLLIVPFFASLGFEIARDGVFCGRALDDRDRQSNRTACYTYQIHSLKYSSENASAKKKLTGRHRRLEVYTKRKSYLTSLMFVYVERPHFPI